MHIAHIIDTYTYIYRMGGMHTSLLEKIEYYQMRVLSCTRAQCGPSMMYMTCERPGSALTWPRLVCCPPQNCRLAAVPLTNGQHKNHRGIPTRVGGLCPTPSKKTYAMVSRSGYQGRLRGARALQLVFAYDCL